MPSSFCMSSGLRCFCTRSPSRRGAYDALRQGIARFSRNELFIILALSWVFASFLQGIAGFGAPIAVVVPLLLAIGVRPVHAATMGVIAHAWARFFGTLGMGWLALLQQAEVKDIPRVAFESSLLILISTYGAGFLVVWLYGRWPAVRHAWPLVLILGTILGVGQLLAAKFSPELSTFLAAAAALLALYPLSRWRRFGEPIQGVPEPPGMAESRLSGKQEEAPVMGLGMSFLPYIVLPAVTLAVLLIPWLNNALRQWRVGLPFPAVDTGFGIRNDAVEHYAPIALTHPGMMLLVTAIIMWLVYQAGGYYRAWAERHKPENLWKAILTDGVPASVPIIAFLVTSRILDHSGQSQVLAFGLAAVSPRWSMPASPALSGRWAPL
jgi:lactate permease